MFSRFLFCLPLIASLSAAVAQQAAPAAHPTAPTNPCDCCAAKPYYETKAWAPFIGTVAVLTQQRPQTNTSVPSLMDQVVVIWDLHIKSGVAFDTWWTTAYPPSNPPTQYFSDPTWNFKNLGDVFGQSLDGKGNIYVAATTAYGNYKVGGLATGSTTQQSTGQIYKIPSNTATPTPVPFALLPNDGNGIGNIHYDCDFDSLYATNFYDGLIYRMNAAGTIQPIKWDHGTNLPSATDAAGNPLSRSAIPITAKDGTFAALGRRVWAVTVYKNRLWYSVWGSYPGHNAGPNVANEVYSVALDANGDAWGSARLEIVLPPFGGNFSYPVSDIAFGPMGTLMVAERTMTSNNSGYGHSSRALEYSFTGSAWVLTNPTAYKIGSYGTQSNSAGSVAFDFSPGGRVWVTGDALHFPSNLLYYYPDYIYGIQGFPQGGGDIFNSILIDADNYVSQHNKTQIGVVRIPCPECANPPAPPVVVGPRSACSPSSYSVTPQAGVTYTWTVTGGTPSTATGSTININWTGGPGTITVTASGPGKCGAVSTFVGVAACTSCEFCNQFKTSLSLASPINLGGGSQYVTPTVTSTMNGVRSVTTTLLSTSVGYSPASCGVAGPLASYIPQAFPSSSAWLNPPTLTVPNGNQAVWFASSVVPLGGGATTPFQLKLPPPPVLNPPCSANFSLCLRVSLATATCQNCDQIQCFGPFPYGAPKHAAREVLDTSRPPPVPTILPDGTIRAAPEESVPTPPAR